MLFQAAVNMRNFLLIRYRVTNVVPEQFDGDGIRECVGSSKNRSKVLAFYSDVFTTKHASSVDRDRMLYRCMNQVFFQRLFLGCQVSLINGWITTRTTHAWTTLASTHWTTRSWFLLNVSHRVMKDSLRSSMSICPGGGTKWSGLKDGINLSQSSGPGPIIVNSLHTTQI